MEIDSLYLFPFNTPRPRGRSNQPSLVPYVVRKTVEIRGDCSEDEAAIEQQRSQRRSSDCSTTAIEYLIFWCISLGI
jgi:hypothetical protein